MSAAAVSIALPTRRCTKRLARSIAHTLRGGDLVIFSGSLGAGKTFLVRALCRALGLPQRIAVTSPTFPLMRELPTAPPVTHADLYRLESQDEVWQLGLDEQRDTGRALLVEWGSPYEAALGGGALHVDIGLSPRVARLSAQGQRAAEMLHSVATACQKEGLLDPSPSSEPKAMPTGRDR